MQVLKINLNIFHLIAISSLVGFIIRRLADLTQFDAERHEGFILQWTARIKFYLNYIHYFALYIQP